MNPELDPALKKWVERVYAPVADAINEFAVQHSMRLDKYLGGKKDWVLAGGHPKGGNIIILLRYNPIWTLKIGGIWQVGCPEKSLFHSHVRIVRRCPITPNAVTAMLEEELAALFATEYGSWTYTRPIPMRNGTQPTA